MWGETHRISHKIIHELLKKDGCLAEFTSHAPHRYTKGESFKIRKENAMNATEFVLFLTILRLVIPFGLILLLGEFIRRREADYWMKV